jgi:hypothetical protein
MPGLRKFIGFAMIALTSYWAFYKEIYLFIPFVIMSIAVATAYEAVSIDTFSGTYRSYMWILGFKLGKPQSLPKIRYVLVKDIVFSHRNSMGAGKTYDDMYEVALACEENVKIPLLYSVSVGEIKTLASVTSHLLKCPIQDFTHEDLMGLQA